VAPATGSGADAGSGTAAAPRILVIGYGNPGRQDDGLGPGIIAELESDPSPQVTLDADYQLTIETAVDLAEADKVIFVDAAAEGPEPFLAKRLAPTPAVHFSSHVLGPEAVLAICAETYHRCPEAVLVGVRGYGFEFAEGLSDGARDNQSRALEFIKTLIEEWRGKNMAGETGKTILIIDDDPDIRAATRIVLESAGFVVGEASTGAEGMKVAQRIRPDAILLDLMMETVDAGSKVSTQLKAAGLATPIFLLSSVGDAVRYNLDAKELGLAGIFQKPIDHQVLLSTLRAELGLK
jgi:hydrogenase maturation protease